MSFSGNAKNLMKRNSEEGDQRHKSKLRMLEEEITCTGAEKGKRQHPTDQVSRSQGKRKIWREIGFTEGIRSSYPMKARNDRGLDLGCKNLKLISASREENFEGGGREGVLREWSAQ